MRILTAEWMKEIDATFCDSCGHPFYKHFGTDKAAGYIIYDEDDDPIADVCTIICAREMYPNDEIEEI